MLLGLNRVGGWTDHFEQWRCWPSWYDDTQSCSWGYGQLHM